MCPKEYQEAIFLTDTACLHYHVSYMYKTFLKCQKFKGARKQVDSLALQKTFLEYSVSIFWHLVN